MSELSVKQRKFTRLIADLIQYAYNRGFELTFGDAYRDPRCPYGAEKSLHKQRLAVDFNLFKDGVYLDKTEDWTPLGEYWESLDPDCCWGGRFRTSAGGAGSDGNHLSLQYGGMK